MSIYIYLLLLLDCSPASIVPGCAPVLVAGVVLAPVGLPHFGDSPLAPVDEVLCLFFVHLFGLYKYFCLLCATGQWSLGWCSHCGKGLSVGFAIVEDVFLKLIFKGLHLVAAASASFLTLDCILDILLLCWSLRVSKRSAGMVSRLWPGTHGRPLCSLMRP